MISLANLKKEKELLESLRGIMDVLKGLAGTRLKTLQSEGFDRSFAGNIEAAFRLLNLQYVVHPFLKQAIGLPKIIVILTPDEGFTGRLASLLIKEAEQVTEIGDEWVVLGERGRIMLHSRQRQFTEFKRLKKREFTYIDARNLTAYFINKYLEKKAGRVDFVFPGFVSITKQTIVNQRILPFHPYKIITSIEYPLRNIIIEPSLTRIVGALIRLWIVQRVNEIFWEARLAEAAARILQLEGSSQELLTMGKKMQFKYLKVMHNINDRKMREVLASRII
ncbi:MAG: F0F1 ATP synthase subunit gamma [Candidatus Omnitrophota bacterium]